jgi:hypothetical protein
LLAQRQPAAQGEWAVKHEIIPCGGLGIESGGGEQ